MWIISRFKITLNNIEILRDVALNIIVPTVQFTSPWTSETINNNRPGYITLESARFLTQAIQIQISLLIFIFNVGLRGSQRSAGFLSLGSSLSCCCPRWVVAWFVLLFLRFTLTYGGSMMPFPWCTLFPSTKWAPVICMCRVFYLESFSTPALLLLLLAQCQLQSHSLFHI